ncbi:hypothetical protein [Nakamurella sp. PAMC28650]|uniref:hypothetical protein n=1 Tax=Nakamurella sp. PAMC28650 TaxID=2762325 RepID=UPI00164E096F|nr:hypothetical protein [Nakamurella sp. PAMC28650]QNK82850.1 hypothetical protein H7F38_09360 [Nakamurella sp. PAMC28650]
MDHIEIGLGLFEAFTIINGRTDSAVQPSIADALMWLRRRLLVAVMNTEAAGPQCTAAIFDAAQEPVAVQWHGTCDELAALLGRIAGRSGRVRSLRYRRTGLARPAYCSRVNCGSARWRSARASRCAASAG